MNDSKNKSKDADVAVKAFANHNITRPDEYGGRETIAAKSVFTTTVSELERLNKLNGAAREATNEEIALQEQRDAKPAAEEEAAGHANVGSYADYEKGARRAEAGDVEEAETAEAAKTPKAGKAGK